MKLRLSTSITFFWKFVFSTIVVLVSGYVTLIVSLSSPEAKTPVLIGYFVGCLIMFFGPVSIKRVHIDDQFLYVSNYLISDRIPLININGLSENIWVSPKPTFVKFKNNTKFGKKIMFIGCAGFFTHSNITAIEEINKRVSAAKNNYTHKSNNIRFS